MSKYDKSLIVKAFRIPENENQEYVILIVNNTYNIDIDNPDIKLDL